MKPFGPVDNGHAAPLRPRLPHGRVARRRGEPVPHRGRLLAVGRRDRRGHALLHGAARLDVIAGGIAQPGDTKFDLEATVGDEVYGDPVEQVPRREGAHEEVHVHGDDRTVPTPGRTTSAPPYDHAIGGTVAHTDRNLLRRVVGVARLSRASTGDVVEPEQLDRGLARRAARRRSALPSLARARPAASTSSSAFTGTTATPSASPTIQSPSCTSTSPTSAWPPMRPGCSLVAPRNAIIDENTGKPCASSALDVADAAVDHQTGDARDSRRRS